VPPKLIQFLLCEDARLDLNGLLSVTGLIWAPIRAAGPGLLPKLTLALMLAGMHGVRRMRTSIDARCGSDPILHHQGEWETRTQHEPDHHLLLHSLAPFPLPRAGDYVLRVGVDFDQQRRAVYVQTLKVEMPPAPEQPSRDRPN
jgi:hypothetical protein